MGKSKSKSGGGLKFLLFLAMLGIGALAVLLGFIFVFIFCIDTYCEDTYRLPPGGQSSCNITNGEFPNGAVEVEVYNDSMAGARIQTLVFTKQPKRVYANETFKWDLEEGSGKYRTYYLSAITGTEYTITIDASQMVDIKYQYRSGKHTYNLYKANDVKSFTGVFTVSSNHQNAYFYIKGSYGMKGTFKVVAKWPRWSWETRDITYTCETYPCDFDLTDPRLVDTDLWFVTVNNGVGTYEVYTKASYDMGVWVPVVVVLIVGGFLLAMAGCVLGVIFAK